MVRSVSRRHEARELAHTQGKAVGGPEEEQEEEGGEEQRRSRPTLPDGTVKGAQHGAT